MIREKEREAETDICYCRHCQHATRPDLGGECTSTAFCGTQRDVGWQKQQIGGWGARPRWWTGFRLILKLLSLNSFPNNVAYDKHVFSDRRVTQLDFSLRSDFPTLYFPFSCAWIIDLFIIAILHHKDLCSIWGGRSLLAWWFSSRRLYHITIRVKRTAWQLG